MKALIAALALAVSTAAHGAELFIPYFPAAGSGDSPHPNGEIRFVNRSATSTTVTLAGKDSAGAAGAHTYTTESIPAGGSVRVTDAQLEDTTRFGNGTGIWSIM